MKKAIEIENVSKIYDLGLVGTGTLYRDLNRTWAKLIGKPDPYATLAELNDRTKKSSSNIVYALKDINFSVNEGEVLGIIGKNGAGKSTLLKILSEITSPSTGQIKMKGRVASLLEVGTGMHPEMTARQNIFLNGSLMGMRRNEIKSKLDEIVTFAGIEKYLDTPTKRFSSGMTVRLGFAIAAFLEPEILIVDEVLAVGDAEFQKKAIGKMKEVSSGQGRTVLFVSHNMAAVKALCDKGVLIDNGEVKFKGEINSVVKKYFEIGSSDKINFRHITEENKGFKLTSICVKNLGKHVNDPIERDSEIIVEIDYENNSNSTELFFNLKFKNDDGEYLIVTTSDQKIKINHGKNQAKMIIPSGFFNSESFSINLMIINLEKNNFETWIDIQDAVFFNVLPEKIPFGGWLGKEVGHIRHKFEWKNQSL
jgi:lipopolysaccharide transport system ATP-binding protein